MPNQQSIFYSDGVIRHDRIKREKVKHCIEIEWISGSTYGGIGFGFDSTYIRYAKGEGPGSKNVEELETIPSLTIPFTDYERVLLCFESKEKREFTVIKDQEKRISTFKSVDPTYGWSIITYNGGNDNSVSDNFAVFTKRSEMKNKIPTGFQPWENDLHLSCEKKSLVNQALLFIYKYIISCVD